MDTSPISALAKKLHIKAGQRWLFLNAPEDYLVVLEPLPDGATAGFNPDGNFNGIQLFVKNSAELVSSLQNIAPLLSTETVFWVTYPKKSSGIGSDLEMMGNWDELAKYGLTTVAAASVNETWTAMRLKPADKTKTSEFNNEQTRKNEHSAFIDLEKRQITLPPDMQQVLAQSPGAMTFYEGLSFSNKKEYVVWILSAKQEKTRTERLGKAVEKLLGGKKNPSEKQRGVGG